MTATDKPDRYRQTPDGQPTVADMVKPGMTVRTSYGTGGIVTNVSGPHPIWNPLKLDYPEGLETYSIVYATPEKYGRHTGKDLGCLNELVAVDGRILKLFGANEDEVLVEPVPTQFPVNRAGQLALF
ncbi:hypothetical protein [Microvirga alba]|uniref:Uncharacterized protein n=1 Tax=Microvirga alba TaxID=2791025 RepID=A0A931BTV7_9HYPH|nr:hypothetical protein [Microvirga alba]MBF9235629.1 hypothetical protein [Microvirga alba]